MPLDKKNFQGGLNRDDDSRVAPNGDYHYAQNIRVLSSEGRNAMLVENIRGTLGKIYSEVHEREGSFDEKGTDFVVVGAYEDKPTSCIYYFVWNNKYFHRILEYNISTDTISTVFRDTGNKFNQVLNLKKDVLVTGINKIEDLLYWTCDNTFVSTKSFPGDRDGNNSYKQRVESNNEPKYINVEKAKAGWKVYYNNGSFNSNPTSDYNYDTMYPYEFYSTNANVEIGEESADNIGGWRKRKYVDVCSYRPHPPHYFYQTPIQNISSSTVTGLQDSDGNALPNIPAGGVSFSNIPIETVSNNPALDLQYKKNDLYGFMWQFAYRYVYKDNEVSAYSEWSWMLPSPQYYSNKLETDKQNFYNQIRVWYHNGPANVRKIEIVARKLNFNFGVEEEGNQGKFYLIATVDNNYYDSSYTANDANDWTPSAGSPTGYSRVSTTNIPYIQAMTSGSPSTVTYSDTDRPPLGFIDFRNDGVSTPVDPVQFEKTYDRVPLRAKSQELVAANRIAYGNYLDGFENTPVRYDLMPIYGSESDPTIFETQFNTDGGAGGTPNANLELGTGSFSQEYIDQMGWTEDNYGGGMSMNFEYRTVYRKNVTENGDNTWDTPTAGGDGYKALCWNTDAVRGRFKYKFPTILEAGQVFNLKFNFRVRFRSEWGTGGNGEGTCYFPHKNWNDNWPPYKYKYFGAQLDLKYTVAAETCSELIDRIMDDINKIMEQTYSDKAEFAPVVGSSPSNEPATISTDDSETVNPMTGSMINHLYKTEDGTDQTPQTYLHSGVQAAAEMRMYCEKGGSNNEELNIYFVPYGQRTAFSDGDSGIIGNMCGGGNSGEEGPSGVSDNDYREFNGCGVYGVGKDSEWTVDYLGNPLTETDIHHRYHDHSDGCVGPDCRKTSPPMIDTSGGLGGATTNIHVWRDNSADSDNTSDFLDALECDGSADEVKNDEGCWDQSNWCGQGTDQDYNAEWRFPSGTSDSQGLVTDGSGWNYYAGGNNNTFGNIDDSNLSFSSTITMANEAGCFKSGAWHRFGIVYYDYKGRSSMVNLQEPGVGDGNRGSSVYVKFPTERIYEEGLNGINSSVSLSNEQKKLPALVGWKLNSKPPAWAEYYHWVYARNTSVSKFLQLRIDRAYKNKGGKPGTTPEDSKNDTKVYLSLNTMDGRDWSYSEKNRSNVGEWAFAEGDRIRLIADRSNSIFSNPDSGIQTYYDFKISEVTAFPGRFDVDTSNNATPNEDGIGANLTLSSDSPVGGNGETQETKPGKFILLEDPGLAGYGPDDDTGDDGEIKAWRTVTVEIYRPKKIKEDEVSLYHEFSERYNIINPGAENRYHDGPIQQQSGTYTTNSDGIEVTPTEAVGVWYRGDVWFKKRYIKRVDEDGNSFHDQFFCEDYFLNDFLNTCHNNIARPHLPSAFAQEIRRKASVTYSDVYQPDTSYNGLHSFPFAQRPYMDYDLSLGSIQEMISRDTDLIIMQEDKISKVLVNKSIISSPGGGGAVSLSSDLLSETATPFTGNYGVCLNPESVVAYGKVVYFVDIKRGAVCRLANDGITLISDYKMADYFRDKMDIYQSILIEDYNEKLSGPLKIIGGYDPRHNEYVVTFPPIYRSTTTASHPSGDKLLQAQSMPNRTTENWNSKADTWEKVYVPEKVVDKEIEKDAEDDIRDETKGPDRVEDKFKSVETRAETLGFSEKANRWVSFYTYYPDYYSIINRKFVSFKFGKLFLHDEDSNNHSMFHFDKMPNEMRLDFSFNTDVSSVKSWQNVSIEGVDRQNIIPIKGKGITATNSQATITGSGTQFTSNNFEVGDSIYYYTDATPVVLTLIGVIQSIDNNTQITLTGNWTGSTTLFTNAFVIPAKNSMYDTRFKTNINESKVNHRLGYNNTTLTAGSWVIREDVGSVRIPYGITNSAGGEYFGIGNGSIADNSDILLSNTASDGSGTTTSVSFINSGLNQGDTIFYDNNGTVATLGTIESMPANTGTLVNFASGYQTSGNSQTLTVDGTNATTYFSVGDRVCDSGGYIVGTVTARTSNSITLDSVQIELFNNDPLYNFDIIILNSSFVSGPLNNTFFFGRKTSTIEGDRLKGHYLETELTKRTKDKVHIYAASANVSKSELSNK